MRQHQSSRRKFLKTSALLSISSLLIPPAIAQLYNKNESIKNPVNYQPPQTRADVRSIDFDSHDFMLNFRA